MIDNEPSAVAPGYVGDRVIDFIATSGLVRTVYAAGSDGVWRKVERSVFTWSANAGEQIGQMVNEHVSAERAAWWRQVHDGSAN